jgi:hypothetical protein
LIDGVLLSISSRPGPFCLVSFRPITIFMLFSSLPLKSNFVGLLHGSEYAEFQRRLGICSAREEKRRMRPDPSGPSLRLKSWIALSSKHIIAVGRGFLLHLSSAKIVEKPMIKMSPVRTPKLAEADLGS